MGWRVLCKEQYVLMDRFYLRVKWQGKRCQAYKCQNEGELILGGSIHMNNPNSPHLLNLFRIALPAPLHTIVERLIALAIPKRTSVDPLYSAPFLNLDLHLAYWLYILVFQNSLRLCLLSHPVELLVVPTLTSKSVLV